uniref:Cholecystokinin receptor-like n=1 Tax=Saccoglossus kowalevskii TaxID=10224 RepID=A0ABM0M546_SACKO|nr:PREDICTED: cholecystokinin receptor-like [Saccoglossus kowalevskii]
MSSEIWSYMDGNYTWNDTDSWYGSYSPPDPAPLEIWLPTVIVYTVTFIVGLIGNILVLFAIQRCRRLRNVTNTFLASLATADLIIIVIVIPFQTPTYFQPTWELGEMMCKLLSYLTLLSSSCSVFMLTALSVERYFVIVHPLLAKSVITLGRARRIIISVWVSAVIYSFPPLYYKKERTWKFDNYDEFQTCVVYWPNDAWAKAFSLYLLLGMYIMPLLVMTYCYARIIHELWISTKRTQQLQNRYGCTLPRRTTSNVSNGVTMNGFHVSHTSMSRTRELGDEELKKCSNMNVRPRVDPEQGRKQVR